MTNRSQIIAIENELVQAIVELRILEEARPEELRTRPLTDLGLDSLSGAHLREFIAETFACDVPDALIGFELRTLRDCAEFISVNAVRHREKS